MSSHIKMICAHCGSDKLLFDASVTWNVDNQKMEIVSWNDAYPFCYDCEDDTIANEEEING